jgi:hypothetical protein
MLSMPDDHFDSLLHKFMSYFDYSLTLDLSSLFKFRFRVTNVLSFPCKLTSVGPMIAIHFIIVV